MNNYSNPVTVTGNPASFEASGNGKLLSLSVPFSPIQDLHGYATPWPAGGGKNLADVRADNATSSQRISVSGDEGDLTFETTGGFGRAGYTVPVVTGQTYTISFKAAKTVSSNANSTLYVNDTDGNWNYSYGSVLISKAVSSEQEYTKTITATSDTLFLGFYISAGDSYPDTVIVKDLQVELGSSKTSYSPYSNICPISGRTGLSVYDDPKYGGTIGWNQILSGDMSTTHAPITDCGGTGVESGGVHTLNLSGSPASFWSARIQFGAPYNRMIAGHKYCLIAVVKASRSGKVRVYLGQGTQPNTDHSLTADTFATIGNISSCSTANFGSPSVSCGSDNASWSANDTITLKSFAVFDLTQMFGSTIADYIYSLETNTAGAGVAWFRNLFPNDYYPYNAGETTCVSAVNGDPYWKKDILWQTEAGTVYGGTLDVVTGVLTVDRACTNLSTSWYWFIGNTQPSGKTVATTTNFPAHKGNIAICSHYKRGSSVYVVNLNNGEFILSDGGNGAYFCFKNEAGGTAQEFKDIIAAQEAAGTPIQVCYELATPLTYQLSATQVELLIGQNNVWSDSNEAVTLTYVIELFTRYTFIVNGNDYTGLVERDSYRTAVTPVYGETIQTLDGVGHTALLRVKGSLTVKLNPQTAAQTAAICADLLNAPCEVQYKCLQRNVNVTALMVLDVVSAMFLSRCLYLGQKWNDVDEIVLKEL